MLGWFQGVFTVASQFSIGSCFLAGFTNWLGRFCAGLFARYFALLARLLVLRKLIDGRLVCLGTCWLLACSVALLVGLDLLRATAFAFGAALAFAALAWAFAFAV